MQSRALGVTAASEPGEGVREEAPPQQGCSQRHWGVTGEVVLILRNKTSQQK